MAAPPLSIPPLHTLPATAEKLGVSVRLLPIPVATASRNSCRPSGLPKAAAVRWRT
ncbi:MAG TPA: hypothetical protein VFN42_03045 [Acetobacteraceae bacterium]|nr:hypothetical protein [Acetobacteraceae bacterium]